MTYKNLQRTLDKIVGDDRPLLGEVYEPMTEEQFEALLVRAQDIEFERLLQQAWFDQLRLPEGHPLAALLKALK